jgi:pimeloyl-ACP methyl ester carboxylesterase
MRPGTLAVREGTLETGWWGPGPTEAPTIVLLHEGLGCVELWRDIPERMAAATGWGVFAYSRLGYGQSSPTALPRPMDYMQQEALTILPQVLLAAEIRHAVLLGHSDGGSIAAIYAGWASPASATAGEVRPWRWPRDRSPTSDDVAAINVLDDDVPRSEDAQPGGHACSRPPHLLGLITIAAHFFVEDLNLASIRQIRDVYDTGELRDRLARYHRHVDIAFRGWNDAWLDPRFRNFDITASLPRIRVPTLGLQGDDDPYGTFDQLRALQANGGAPTEIKLIPGARHAPHLEAKEPTLAAITHFIAGLPRDIAP